MPKKTTNNKNTINLVNFDFGKLSESANLLINKLSQAGGVLYRPIHNIRMAKAEAKVKLIESTSAFEISEFENQSLQRIVEEQTIHQINMEKVVLKALTSLVETANPNDIDNDWLAFFFNKARIVSDDYMQELWARVLAGEANNPGTYSKRTVSFLNNMSKYDAVLFAKVHNYSLSVNGEVLLVTRSIDWGESNDYHQGQKNLDHLESIGLIKVSNYGEKALAKDNGIIKVKYFSKEITITSPAFEDEAPRNYVSILSCNVTLTRIGMELISLSEKEFVEGFADSLSEFFEPYSVAVKDL